MLIARTYSPAATPRGKTRTFYRAYRITGRDTADVTGDARQRAQIDRKPVTGRRQKLPAIRIVLQEGALVEARITLTD